MNSATAAHLFRRKDFTGVTDKYARRRTPINPLRMAIDDAIAGAFPFDPSGSFIRAHMHDAIVHRLNRYHEGNRFYDGEHWTNPLEDGEKKAVFNYCGTIVDKAVDWHEAKGWTIHCREGNEQVAELLNAVWSYNQRSILSVRSAQFAAKNGDSYFYVTVRTSDNAGNRLPRKEWTVRLQALDPAHVFPIWRGEGEDREMLACLVQVVTDETIEGSIKPTLMSIWITPNTITTWMNEEEISQIENPIGEVNVVHVPNFELAGAEFGESDIKRVIPINEEYNIIAASTRATIKYHSEPTTVIYGARASNLEKGANKVWSGLPKPSEAKVENLQLQSDLTANFAYLERLERQICELSSTPKVAFDSFDMRAVANSLSTFKIMFQPLFEKTFRRQICHSVGIEKVNRLILLFQQRLIGTDIEALADNTEDLYRSFVEYTSPLPGDEAVELDLGIKRVNAGVWSTAELVRRLSGVKNHERLVIELIADKTKELEETYEKQRALMGERPNSMVAFLGSVSLSEELESLQQQIATLQSMQKESPLTTEMKREKEKNKQLALKQPKQATVQR